MGAVENRLAEEEHLRPKAPALVLRKPARSLGGKTSEEEGAYLDPG